MVPTTRRVQTTPSQKDCKFKANDTVAAAVNTCIGIEMQYKPHRELGVRCHAVCIFVIVPPNRVFNFNLIMILQLST